MLPPLKTYEEFVSLSLNVEWERASRITDMADAIKLGTDKAFTPEAWIELLCKTDEEKSAWRLRELRKM